LQLRLLKVGKFYAINEPLTRLNILDEDEHLGGLANLDNITKYFQVFINKHYDDYRQNKKSLAFCYLRLATLYRQGARFKETQNYLRKAWQTRPWNLIYFYYMIKFILKRLINKKV